MTDSELFQLGMLGLAVVGMALGFHRYVVGTADALRKEWKLDDAEICKDIDQANNRLEAMRERLATKDDLIRVETSIKDINQTVSRQGAIEERVVGVQRQLDILIGYFKNGDPSPRKLGAGD